MLNYLRAIICIIVLVTDLAAQTGTVRADNDSASVRELIALEHLLSGLLNAGNWQAYAPYVAEDYRQTNRNAEVRTKDDVIRALQRRGSEKPEVTTTPDSIRVRVYGEAGILTAILTGRNASDGSISFRSRILKTFVRRDGRWYLVAMQGTPFP